MATPDLVTWISDSDRRTDRRTVRGRERLVLPGVAPAPPLQSAGKDGRRVVLAGDWRYPPNADGLAWFVSSVLPRLSRLDVADGGAIHVYGRDAPPLPRRLVVHGHAVDSRELYQVGDVHVAPVRFGGGVKRKVLSPLLAGLPVVTTEAGAHGLRPSHALDVSDDPAVFAEFVLHRLRTPTPLRRPVISELADRDDTTEITSWLRARAGVDVGPARGQDE